MNFVLQGFRHKDPGKRLNVTFLDGVYGSFPDRNRVTEKRTKDERRIYKMGL